MIGTRSEQKCFGGVQGFYEHASTACAGPMRFSVFLPPLDAGQTAPALYWLSGLSCNEEVFPTKAGAQRIAAELGVALIACDTSPRAARFPGDDEHWDFGLAAGFYLDATQSPWSAAYRMRSYVADELPAVIESHFPIRPGARAIFGHSMGGHGALTLALTYPDRYRSVSAFAPIVAPSQVPWGQKAFSRYLGDDRSAWAAYDTVELLRTRSFPGTLLVDQGTADKFLERELKPELLLQAATFVNQSLDLRLRDGYDHSYYFISTFIEDHLRHHARALDT
jgi:S-formylglutathione hydrolase